MLGLDSWLKSSLESLSLSTEDATYLVGRGCSPSKAEEWGIKTWAPSDMPCPDPSLCKKHGPRFEQLTGKTIYPLYSPRGDLVGFDSRTSYRKDEMRIMLRDCSHIPVWIGMPSAMAGVFRDLPLFVVEGRYDVFAMQVWAETVGADCTILGSGPAHLRDSHINFISRWCSAKVTLVYDMDAAGIKGSRSASKKLEAKGTRVYVAKYGRPGDDPGLILETGGVDLLLSTFSSL